MYILALAVWVCIILTWICVFQVSLKFPALVAVSVLVDYEAEAR